MKVKIDRVFELAKLKKSEDEKLIKDIKKIIKWVDKLKELDVKTSEKSRIFERETKLRKDKKRDFKNKKQLYDNMPQSENNYFVVPEVIKK